ncbi:MAG: glycosyltransferase family 4 protein [Verrucomicrobiota bacterium]
MTARLNIVFLTPGTGGWYCGACMRDNALAKALHAAGHEVSLLPMYLPLQLDEEMLESPRAMPVFFGGINIYLQQKFALFRHTPAWLDKLLNHPRLLRKAAGHSHMTSARDHGELTLAMLRMGDSSLDKELDKLCAWLEQERPDILCLSTALQAGMIRELKRRLGGVKVICCFQGEDTFLDSLPAPYRNACWRNLAARVRDADRLISPSAFYADLMQRRLGPAALTIEVMANGINLDGYAPLLSKPGPPVIGFLARMCREKGLDIMVEAFIYLRMVLGHPDARLHLAGAATADNQPLIESLQQRLAAVGLTDQVQWQTNISRAAKIAMLRSLSLFSVPVTYPEAFGLYVIEAMAAGVPVVQPATAAFPEIVARAGVGVLVSPGGAARLEDSRLGCQEQHASRLLIGRLSRAMPPSHGLMPPARNEVSAPPACVDPATLARAWHELLLQPNKLCEMAAASRHAAEQFYAVSVMRDRFLELAGQLLTCGTGQS